MMPVRTGWPGCRQTHPGYPPLKDVQACAEGAHRAKGGDPTAPPFAVSSLVASYDFVSQKTFAISSMLSRSCWPCAGSRDFFAFPASFVAFQNSS